MSVAKRISAENDSPRGQMGTKPAESCAVVGMGNLESRRAQLHAALT